MRVQPGEKYKVSENLHLNEVHTFAGTQPVDLILLLVQPRN